MSRIYFHSSSKEAEVRGIERKYAACLVSDLFMANLQPLDYPTPHWLLRLFPNNHRLHRLERGATFGAIAPLYLRQTGNDCFVFNGDSFSIWETALNTALFMGNDAIKLLARLHGQCEIHCYVEPQNKIWFRDIISTGLVWGLLRRDMGWESVIELASNALDEPVVCSYSVTDQFPNWDNEKDRPLDWEAAMAMHRTENNHLEIKPSNFNNYYLGHGISAFDLYDMADGKYDGQTLESIFPERNQKQFTFATNEV